MRGGFETKYQRKHYPGPPQNVSISARDLATEKSLIFEARLGIFGREQGLL